MDLLAKALKSGKKEEATEEEKDFEE
ncbi:hypothetical protein LCGC14_2211300, partial [marine sediment metagenome]